MALGTRTTPPFRPRRLARAIAARRWRRALRRARELRQNTSGAALVEFTLILPVMLSLLLGGTQYGLMLYVYNNMQDAARTAVRQLALSRVTAAEAEALARSQLVAWPTSWTITAEDIDVTGTAEVRVLITLPTIEAAVFNFVPMPTQLRAEVVFPKE